MNAIINRQPILDGQFSVDGFELSFPRTEDASSGTAYSGEDSAICRILTNAFCGFDAAEATSGRPVYVSFTNNLLLEGLPDLYPTDKFIVEVPPNLFLDETLAERLSELNYRGYRLSLKSYTPTVDRVGNAKHLGMFDVVRLDIGKYNRLKIKEFVRTLRKYRMRIMAENIRTPEDLAFAREVGFDLYQGSVFGEPSTLRKYVSLRDIPYGKLFNHMMTGRVNRALCARIIQQDPALTHMFLRKVFNSLHNRKAPESEVERGLTRIDDEKLRHWSAVLLLDQACMPGMYELVPQVYRRGLIMERLAEAVDLDVPESKAFMFGVVSALDRILGEDKSTLSRQLALGNTMRAAFMESEENGYSTLLRAVEAYEANPEAPKLPAAFSKIPKDDLAKLFWSCQVNTEYITLSLEYTVPEPYKGNVLR